MPYSPLELANAHLEAGELDDALRALNTELTEHPDNDEALRLRAAIRARGGNDDSRRRALADLARLPDPTTDDLIQQVALMTAIGDINAALELLERAARPGDERIAHQHIALLMSAGRHADARALLDTMPQTWRWLQLSGDLAAVHEGAERAIQDYTRALHVLDALPTDALVDNFRARLLASRARLSMQQDDWDHADADYASAQAIVPGDPMFAFLRGVIAAQRGDLAEALGLCGEALTAAPDALRDQMETLLRTDPRCATLAMLLLQGDADI